MDLTPLFKTSLDARVEGLVSKTSLDLTPLFKTSLDTRVEGLVSKEIWQKKDIWRAHKFRSLDCNFSFCTTFYTADDSQR